MKLTLKQFMSLCMQINKIEEAKDELDQNNLVVNNDVCQMESILYDLKNKAKSCEVTLGENHTCYLLEVEEDGKLVPCEISVGLSSIGEAQYITDHYINDEVNVGFLKSYPDAWEMYGDDWEFRLGVDFDPRCTPTDNPREDGIWEGVCEDGVSNYNNGKKWRVTRLNIDAVISDKAKQFFLDNCDAEVEFSYM